MNDEKLTACRDCAWPRLAYQPNLLERAACPECWEARYLEEGAAGTLLCGSPQAPRAGFNYFTGEQNLKRCGEINDGHCPYFKPKAAQDSGD